jgi:hypothetical protein
VQLTLHRLHGLFGRLVCASSVLVARAWCEHSSRAGASEDAHFLRGQIAALRDAGAISMANSGDVDVSVVLGATDWTSNVVNDRYLLVRREGDNFGTNGKGRTTPRITVYRAAACAGGGARQRPNSTA